MIWEITQEEVGLTVEDWLHHRVPQAPKSYLRQLIRKGSIRLEGHLLEPHSRVDLGMSIQLPDSQRLLELLKRPTHHLTILAETDLWVAVDKPAGLPVHPTDTNDGHDMQSLLTEHYRNLRAPFKVAPAHRIDRGTSGAVIFGKGRKALALLGKTFMNRQIQKYYLALVAGPLTESLNLVSPVVAKGKTKEAQAIVTPLDHSNDCSLVRLELMTGRTHQLRQQLAKAGFPILGDTRYGRRQLLQSPRLCLHSWFIKLPPEFQHQQPIVAPLPRELHQFIIDQGLNEPQIETAL